MVYIYDLTWFCLMYRRLNEVGVAYVHHIFVTASLGFSSLLPYVNGSASTREACVVSTALLVSMEDSISKNSDCHIAQKAFLEHLS